MSFVQDHVKAIDSSFDALQLSNDWHQVSSLQQDYRDVKTSAHVASLQTLIKALSTASISRSSLLNAQVVIDVLNKADISSKFLPRSTGSDNHRGDAVDKPSSDTSYEHELQWLLVGKATIQAYGIVLDTLLQQTVMLNDELWYWSDVPTSLRYTGLYYIQTSPMRCWNWSRNVVHDIQQQRNFVTEGWQQFYDMVRNVIREHSVADIRHRVSGPLVRVRAEIHEKKARLERAKLNNASAIGIVLSNGFNSSRLNQQDLASSQGQVRPRQDWKLSIAKTVGVLNSVLGVVYQHETADADFEKLVENYMEEHGSEDSLDRRPNLRGNDRETFMKPTPTTIVDTIQQILGLQLPAYVAGSTASLKQCRRPSRLARYWFPALILLLSSSTVLRVLVRRKAEMIQWIQELGATTIDFWTNWVIEPVKKVIGTIRHDEGSEISIMSRRSLEGDRASLERMVVDFANDVPDDRPLSQVETSELRNKVQEGDLTPVLKVYEKELRSPLIGTLRGNLIRALLIQIQKTKVDIEVAMSGIDALLKSQELVFGFVGLTPGILVSLGLFRWIGSLSSRRRSMRRGEKQSQSYDILRNIDRILTRASNDPLAVKDYGLLVCEAIVLRHRASQMFPKREMQKFSQDFDDLIDNTTGVVRQMRVVDRIRWAYSKWL